MVNKDILTSKEELGLVAKKIFYEAEDKEASNG